MYTIVFDTSSKKSLCSVINQNNIVCNHFFDPIDDATIFEFLEFLNVKISNVIVGVGPGSYMGLRVGMVIAQFFAYINSLNIKSVCSLKGLVPSDVIMKNGTTFACLSSARGAGFYCIDGIYKDGFIWNEPKIISKDGIDFLLQEYGNVFLQGLEFCLANCQTVQMDPLSLFKFANEENAVFYSESLFSGLNINYLGGSRSSSLYGRS